MKLLRRRPTPPTATPRRRVGPGFEPLPDGFKWTPISDSYLPLTCGTCHCSVTPSAAAAHTAWHKNP